MVRYTNAVIRVCMVFALPLTCSCRSPFDCCHSNVTCCHSNGTCCHSSITCCHKNINCCYRDIAVVLMMHSIAAVIVIKFVVMTVSQLMCPVITAIYSNSICCHSNSTCCYRNIAVVLITQPFAAVIVIKFFVITVSQLMCPVITAIYSNSICCHSNSTCCYRNIAVVLITQPFAAVIVIKFVVMTVSQLMCPVITDI